MTQSEDRSPLVSTEWLAEHLDDPTLAIVEVDEDVSIYAEEGHIPGAIIWDWKNDLQHPSRRDYLSREELTRLFETSGVTTEHEIVLYGGNGNWFAAYAYWLLKVRGATRVRLLDGGRQKWVDEGRPLSQSSTAISESTNPPELGPSADQLRFFRDDVLDSNGQVRYVDVRSPEEFSGEVLAPPHLPAEQPYVGGHIPGAFNIPWSKAVNDDGSFRCVAELGEIYDDVIAEGVPIVTYCRIGERAAHTWFVLSELLGLRDTKNYDGSWTEYGSLVGVPVATGSKEKDR